MDFVTNIFKKYIQNDKQQEEGKTDKLLGETTRQKPRRSVLKEFDPFAPPSPFTGKKGPDTIDEDDLYEDAQTSLTSFLCQRVKKSQNLETQKTPIKAPINNGSLILIPGLQEFRPMEEGNLNDTADLSYAEALENLSQDNIKANLSYVTSVTNENLNNVNKNDIAISQESSFNLSIGSPKPNKPEELRTYMQEINNANNQPENLKIDEETKVALGANNLASSEKFLNNQDNAEEEKCSSTNENTSFNVENTSYLENAEDKTWNDNKINGTFEVHDTSVGTDIEKKSSENYINQIEDIVEGIVDNVFASNTNNMDQPQNNSENINQKEEIVKDSVFNSTFINTDNGDEVKNAVVDDMSSKEELVNHSVINISNKNIDNSEQVGEIIVPSSATDELNATYITPEQELESMKAMESLAHSMNQTIDDEPPITDDADSSRLSNMSDDSDKQSVNVTIELIANTTGNIVPVVDDLDRKTAILRPIIRMDSAENTHYTKDSNLQQKMQINDSVLSQSTQVDQSNEKKECKVTCGEIITSASEEKLVDAIENDGKTGNVVEFKKPNQELGVSAPAAINVKCTENTGKVSLVFQRQDTLEFEALEKECQKSEESEQMTRVLNVIAESCENKPLEVVKTIEAQNNAIPIKETIEEKKDRKEVVLEQEEVQDLGSKEICSKNTETNTQKETTGAVNKTNEEEYLKDTEKSAESLENLDKITIKKTPEQTIEICSKESQSEITETDAQKDLIGAISTSIETEYLTNIEKKSEEDSDKLILKNVPEHTLEICNKESQSKVSKTDTRKDSELEQSVVQAKSKVECRPSITAVSQKENLNEDTVTVENCNNKTTSIINDVEQVLKENEELKSQIEKLENAVTAVKTENNKKDQQLLISELEKEGYVEEIKKFQQVLRMYEAQVARQHQDLVQLKEECDGNARQFNNLEMAFSDVFEKYQKSKVAIEMYSKNEEILKHNLSCAETKIVQLDGKCAALHEQLLEQVNQARQQVHQEKEKYNQEIAKLQAHAKRLEIKASSLETALKQKTEECQQLAALCDEVTGKPL